MNSPFLLVKEKPWGKKKTMKNNIYKKEKWVERETVNNIFNKGMRVKGDLQRTKFFETSENSYKFSAGNRRFCSLKGQMLLVAAILIVISLVLLKNMTGIFATTQEEEVGEAIVLDSELRNIKNEYNYITSIAVQQSVPNVSAIDGLYNISDLLRNDKDVEILYMLAFVNGTDQRYTVTVGNFINDRINATVNVTGSSTLGSYFGTVNDKTNATAQFFPSANGTVSITLNYTLQTNNITEIIQANISTKNHFSLFYDITLKGSNIFVRAKDIYNTTW